MKLNYNNKNIHEKNQMIRITRNSNGMFILHENSVLLSLGEEQFSTI